MNTTISRMIRIVSFSILATLGARADMANDPMPFILRGMEKYAFPVYSDTFCAYGNEMLPVLSGGPSTQMQAVAVAGEFGAGRFVAYGHRSFIDGSLFSKGDNSQLLRASLWWASTHKVGKNKPGFVGVMNLPPAVTDFLQAEGFSAQETTLTDLEGIQCVLADISELKDNEVEILRKIAEGGGGLVVAGDASQWVKIHPDKNIALDYPPNKLFAPRGCFWNGEAVALPQEPAKPVAASPLLHGRDALNLAIKIADGRAKPDDVTRRQVSFILNRAFYYCPPDDQALLPDLHHAMHVASLRAFPTVETPIKIGDVLPRLFVSDKNKEFLTKPVDAIQPHPSALNFPGTCDAEPSKNPLIIRIDPTVTRFQSTGLYASPGDLISVSMPTQFVNLKLRVRIGIHADKLWTEDSWTRYPELCREFPMNSESNTIGIAFGGPIYVMVPPGTIVPRGDTNRPPVPLQMRFVGALTQPYFIRGVTSGDWWNEVSSRAPAPWCEFGSRTVVFSIPSKLVRNSIPKPNGFMSAWDGFVGAQRELAGCTNRTYAERITCDTQPFGGVIHSGYPVVLTMDRAHELLSLRGLADGSMFDILGLIGQNMVPPAIAFEGSKPMFANLFTLYAAETFVKRPVEEYIPDMGGEKRTNRLAAYFAQGAKFDTMKADPMYGTIMLHQLAAGLGWPAMQKMFQTAATMSEKTQPLGDDTRRDVFAVLLSTACTNNVVPFLRRWGLEIGELAAAKCAKLPEWKCVELDHLPAAPTAPIEPPKAAKPVVPAAGDTEKKAGPVISPL